MRNQSCGLSPLPPAAPPARTDTRGSAGDSRRRPKDLRVRGRVPLAARPPGWAFSIGPRTAWLSGPAHRGLRSGTVPCRPSRGPKAGLKSLPLGPALVAGDGSPYGPKVRSWTCEAWWHRCPTGQEWAVSCSVSGSHHEDTRSSCHFSLRVVLRARGWVGAEL